MRDSLTDQLIAKYVEANARASADAAAAHRAFKALTRAREASEVSSADAQRALDGLLQHLRGNPVYVYDPELDEYVGPGPSRTTQGLIRAWPGTEPEAKRGLGD